MGLKAGDGFHRPTLGGFRPIPDKIGRHLRVLAVSGRFKKNIGKMITYSEGQKYFATGESF
jgi:hypothetical protein